MATKYKKRKGLEGPIEFANGRVLYKVVDTGEYWDPTTDFFLGIDELNQLKQELFDIVKGK